MTPFTEQMGREAMKELQDLVRRNLDIRNVEPGQVETHKKAVELLLSWISQVYGKTMPTDTTDLFGEELDFQKMYKFKD